MSSTQNISDLAVSSEAVSSALDRDGLEAQKAILYVLKAILDPETRYPKTEKLILALIVSARK